MFFSLRDQTLITGRGGGYKTGGGGGKSSFTPTTKRWWKFVVATLKGGTISFQIVLTQEIKVLAKLKGRNKFPPFERGRGQTVLTVLDPQFSHFVANLPPLPIINDQFLIFSYSFLYVYLAPCTTHQCSRLQSPGLKVQLGQKALV